MVVLLHKTLMTDVRNNGQRGREGGCVGLCRKGLLAKYLLGGVSGPFFGCCCGIKLHFGRNVNNASRFCVGLWSWIGLLCWRKMRFRSSDE